MKKATFVNLIIIISLLIFCVMTLIAIYATSPDSSVLLLEEHFNILDENKWRHEISECKEGEQYHYITGNEESGLIADGILQIQQNFTDLQYKTKREALKNCLSCDNSKNSSSACAFSSFFAKLQTKNLFNASCGQIKVRAKARSGSRIRFYIKITPEQNSSEPKERSESFLESVNETETNNSSVISIFFESFSNKALVKSPITDDHFHVYEINWDEEKIYLNIDQLKVDEIKLVDLEEESISNTKAEFNSTPIIQPFVLNIGIDVQEGQKNSGHTKNERSSEDTAYYTQDNLKETNLFEMDYIKLFKTFN